MNINDKPLTATQMRDYIASQDPAGRAQKKLIKRMKKHREFTGISADVRQMCIEAGHPEYYTSISNRIFRAMDANPALMNCVMIDLSQPDEIRLPDSGIVAFRDILVSYFTEKDLDALHEYLQAKTELEQCEYSILQSIKTTSTKALKCGIIEWDNMANRKEIERGVADRLKDMAQRELKARKKIF